MLLIQYRYDMTSLEKADRERIIEQLDKRSYTGVTLETPAVCTCFFEESEPVDEIIPLPKNCVRTRI